MFPFPFLSESLDFTLSLDVPYLDCFDHTNRYNKVGYWPGTLVFFFFGLLAFYTGILLWHMFIKLDSPQYPLHHFGDLAERIYGKWARHRKSLLSFNLILDVQDHNSLQYFAKLAVDLQCRDYHPIKWSRAVSGRQVQIML